jgi:hypothetical protein
MQAAITLLCDRARKALKNFWRKTLMRAAKTVLIVCLLCLATTAFADIFPLFPPPDLFIDTFTYTGPTLTGTVESITDVGNCSAVPCFANLTFLADSSGWLVYGTDTTDVYLSGGILDIEVGSGGEAGLLLSVLFEDAAKWSALEGQTATSFGSLVALDLHNFDPNFIGFQPNATADLAPTQTPEPATLSLLAGGLAAALTRKKFGK